MSTEKKLIIDLYNNISGEAKSVEQLRQYISDPVLIDYIMLYEKSFPEFSLFIDEITSEGKRTVVKGRIKASKNPASPLLAGTNSITHPFAMGYRIKNNKVCQHWIISDRQELMKALPN